MKAAIYARVSTTDQTCELQLRELREYCARRGWEIVGEYVDTGFSGTKKSRPELDHIMTDARARRFDCIMVWKLDRWGRSVVNSLASIQELTSLGVRWLAITQNLDTDESNPMSRFMLMIMAAFAEFEREMIRERVVAGLQNAKAKGRKLGRKPKVFDRSRVISLRQQSKSLREIAKSLDVSLATIQRTLAGRSDEPAARNGVSKTPRKTRP